MRVTMIPGVKRVTVLGGPSRAHAFVRGSASSSQVYGATDKLKFTVIKPDGNAERGELHVELGPVKRESRKLRPIERRIRKMVRAEYKALGRYLVLHDKSRRRQRNGWVKDLKSNLAKVIRNRN